MGKEFPKMTGVTRFTRACRRLGMPIFVLLAVGPAAATPNLPPRTNVPGAAKPAPAKGLTPPRRRAPLPLHLSALPREPAVSAPAVHLLPRPPGPPDDPREQRIAHLREQVESILRSPPLSRLRVGIEVSDAESGDELLSQNAATPFNPASNTKILTTAAAMQLLGADWRYRTVLLAPEKKRPATVGLGSVAVAESRPGVIHGDLFLQGSGDPSLTTSGIAQLARSLSRAGITRIEGDLLVDDQFRALPGAGKQGPAPAGPAGGEGPGALIVNRNSYAVHVSPGGAGHPASAFVEPRSSYFVVDSRVSTVRGKRIRLLVDHYRKDGHLVISVRGRIGEQHEDAVVKRHMPEGGVFAAVTLAQALSDFGIELTGQVKIGPPPAGALWVVAEHQSSPLSEVCALSNKDSNNFVADTIFKTLGGERFGLPGTLAKGARAVGEWLSLLGLDPAHVKIINGSGLTHENRVTPKDLSRLLLSLYHDIQLAPEFLQTLAIGGIDGTIHYRFHGPSVGLVRAKTGTLAGVSALSGYVGEKKGVLVFSILVEGFGQRRLDAVRHAQVLIVESLLRYLQADKTQPGPLPAAPPPAPDDGPRDSENGEEGEGDPV
jgi:D-alanyl-D-alanine carboxypeptidase/D-alanyl-D-alanine-endopeptidase (penicillin-binding protein 4)